MAFYLVTAYNITAANAPIISTTTKHYNKWQALQDFYKLQALASLKQGLYYIGVQRYKAPGIASKSIVKSSYYNGKQQTYTGIN